MKIFSLKSKKVLIPFMLVAIIATANIFIANNSTRRTSNEVTLNNITKINFASAEDHEWESYTPDPEQSGWQNFWASVGNFFDNVWGEICDFFSDWVTEPLYDEVGNIIGVSFSKSW